jgi:hypothetical protein
MCFLTKAAAKVLLFFDMTKYFAKKSVLEGILCKKDHFAVRS